jgi:Ca2+-binding RTX toxin-like protein
MAAYTFQTISAAQAAAYSAADSLVIDGAANQVSVAFQAGPEPVAITLGGLTVDFGAGIINDQDVTFSSGGSLVIGSAAAESAAGGAAADALFGGDGADSLAGGDGADLLQGNQGADTLDGGAGSDTIYAGQNNDVITLGDAAGEANFTNGNKGADTITASAGADTLLGGQDNDLITGGGGGNFLNGNLGDDTVRGGAGTDTILGEGGRDVLSGGGGGDVFVFGAGASALTQGGADVILDWSPTYRIDAPLTGYAELVPAASGGDPYYGGRLTPGTPYSFDTALDAANNLMAMDPGLHVVAAQVASDVIVYIDTDSQGGADMAVVLTGASVDAMDAANFI